jgi:hypothetical protein
MNLFALGLALALILIWYLTSSANRLDRLHHRVETSWANLDAILQRRAAIAQEIAHLAEIDPATNLILTGAAHSAREAEISERSQAESGLSEIFDELAQINERIRVAIAIHQEAVRATLNRRRKLIYRIFRLAGHAPLPVTYPFEDDVL